MTAQGHPRAIFKLAIERGNVVGAEASAREFALTLEEALQLVLLYVAYEPAKVERAALRWFARYLDEGKRVSLFKAQLALAALGQLRTGDEENAATLLAELARQRVSGRSAASTEALRLSGRFRRSEHTALGHGRQARRSRMGATRRVPDRHWLLAHVDRRAGARAWWPSLPRVR